MLNRFTRNVGVQLLSLAVTFFDRIVIVGLLVHQWGAALYADWVVLLSAAGLLQLGELGLNIYYGNVWQRAAALGDHQGFARMLRVSLGIAAIQAGVLLIAAVAFLVFADIPLVLKLASADHAGLVFILLAAFSVLAVLRGSLSQLYRGDGRYARGMLVTLIGTLALLLATLLVVTAGGELLELASAYLLCQLTFGIGLTVWDLRRCFPSLRFTPTLPLAREWREAWRNTRWLALEQCAPIVWLRVPILILGLAGVGGAALVGFVLLRTLVGFTRQLCTMLSIAVGVELAGLVPGDPVDLQQQIRIAGRFLSAISGVLGAAVIVFGSALVGLWSGNSTLFDPAVAFWMVLGSLAAAPAAPLTKLLAFTNRARPNAVAWIGQLCLGLCLAALLIEPFGVAGVAAGLAFGEMIAMGLILPVLAMREWTLPLRRYWLDCGAALGMSFLWCLLVGAAIKAFIEVSDAQGLFAALAIWTVLAAIPALLFAVPAAWRRMMLGRLLRQQGVDQGQEA